ncbi:MAG: ribokinase [Vallitaleaceae bacterium]|nr:ribokinase [Vallitaleaceae bacterium]
MQKICVIGSINMDLTAVVNRFPTPGETLTGISFGSYPGGKGANQAVAIGRLGGNVMLLGKVGGDPYGQHYLEVLKENAVNEKSVFVEREISTGIAVIEVDQSGENKIIVVPGANGLVDIDFIDKHYETIREYDVFLFQLEIPLETVLYTMKRLKEDKKTIILDPAPARELPDEIFQYIEFITPNETEIEVLTGRAIINEVQVKEAAEALLAKGVQTVIVKAGKDGAYIVKNEQCTHVRGFRVNAIDTTAAGDSFNGGLAFSLAMGNSVEDSVRFANAVAAISTTSIGAQGAMPTLAQANVLMGAN